MYVRCYSDYYRSQISLKFYQPFPSAVMKIQASCYNINAGAWEPLIEPCIKEENIYKPWEMTFRVRIYLVKVTFFDVSFLLIAILYSRYTSLILMK